MSHLGVSAGARWTGILAALPGEAATLLRPPPHTPRTVVRIDAQRQLIRSGIGPQRAAAAAEQLVAGGAGALLSWGTAGGLNPQLAPGTLVLAERVIDDTGRVWTADTAWRLRLRAALAGRLDLADGTLLSAAAALLSAADKAAALNTHAAQAVDMESAAVAAVAAKHGLPLLVVRVIADDAGDALPRSALAAIDADGHTRPWALAASLAHRPGDIAGLIRLGRRYAAATRSLRAIAALAAAELAYPSAA